MNWIEVVEWIARLILLGLVLLSIWSVGIIIDKKRFFSKWKRLEPLDTFKHKMHSSLSITDDPRADYLNALQELPASAYDNVFTAFINEAQKKWSKGLAVLGTLGSITPFIGLVGTVLGIIVAFGELAAGSVDMKIVMFSLAEALILTAMGLAVAIPAVIAFNHFNARINIMIKDLESTKELYKVMQHQRSSTEYQHEINR